MFRKHTKLIWVAVTKIIKGARSRGTSFEGSGERRTPPPRIYKISTRIQVLLRGWIDEKAFAFGPASPGGESCILWNGFKGSLNF